MAAMTGGTTLRSGQRRASKGLAVALDDTGGVTRTNGAGSERLAGEGRAGGEAAGVVAEGIEESEGGEATATAGGGDFDDGGRKARLLCGGGRVVAGEGAFAEEGSIGGATAGWAGNEDGVADGAEDGVERGRADGDGVGKDAPATGSPVPTLGAGSRPGTPASIQ